jgi:hypothetical protein
VKEEEDKCGCPVRDKALDLPTALLVEPVRGNIPRLRKWIVDNYRPLAFNQCTHQVLCVVDSPPLLNLSVDYLVKPRAIHKPAQVPLHFIDEVREGMKKDVCLGVLERVPENTPNTWCSRMCVVPKKNGNHTFSFAKLLSQVNPSWRY